MEVGFTPSRGTLKKGQILIRASCFGNLLLKWLKGGESFVTILLLGWMFFDKIKAAYSNDRAAAFVSLLNLYFL